MKKPRLLRIPIVQMLRWECRGTSHQSHSQAGVAPNPSPLLSVNPVSEIRVGWVSYNPPTACPRHVESCS